MNCGKLALDREARGVGGEREVDDAEGHVRERLACRSGLRRVSQAGRLRAHGTTPGRGGLANIMGFYGQRR